MITCPVCNIECNKTTTSKGNYVSYVCEVTYARDPLNNKSYNTYHQFIWHSNINFMIGLYYTIKNHDQSIILGAYGTFTSNEYIFRVNDFKMSIDEFQPCDSLEIMNRYMKIISFI